MGMHDLKINGYFTRSYRMTRLAMHVLYAMAMAAFIFPWVAENIRLRLERRWSAGMMRILNIHVRVRGIPPDLHARNAMLIANHISWLDIYLLCSLRPARFVSKAEVRTWPLVGWLAYKVGTFFIDRTRRHDTARVNHEMSAALSSGGCVAVFPEGTTSHGDTLLPFHASLLQPAVHSESKIWPAAIRYTHADGSLNLAATYVGEVSFGESLEQILRQPQMYAELVFMEPISTHGKTRRDLARQAELAIAGALNLALPSNVSVGEPPTVTTPELAPV
jgi:1-acyl-sn-glycerol-3-phosphate acyltransferase